MMNNKMTEKERWIIAGKILYAVGTAIVVHFAGKKALN